MIYLFIFRAVTDPRDGRRVALKKLPNVFQSLVSSKRVFRELKMLCFFKHENVSKLLFVLNLSQFIINNIKKNTMSKMFCACFAYLVRTLL